MAGVGVLIESGVIRARVHFSGKHCADASSIGGACQYLFVKRMQDHCRLFDERLYWGGQYVERCDRCKRSHILEE